MVIVANDTDKQTNKQILKIFLFNLSNLFYLIEKCILIFFNSTFQKLLVFLNEMLNMNIIKLRKKNTIIKHQSNPCGLSFKNGIH